MLFSKQSWKYSGFFEVLQVCISNPNDATDTTHIFLVSLIEVIISFPEYEKSPKLPRNEFNDYVRTAYRNWSQVKDQGEYPPYRATGPKFSLNTGEFSF